MATAKQDYTGFLRWLHAHRLAAPENVRCFANLVLADFECIANTAPQRHARSAHLAALSWSYPGLSSSIPWNCDVGAEWPI